MLFLAALGDQKRIFTAVLDIELCACQNTPEPNLELGGSRKRSGASGTAHPTEARALCGQLALLDEMPRVDQTLAALIIAELGVDMLVFASVFQLLLGRSLSREQRIRRRAQEQPRPQGQRLSEDGLSGRQRGGQRQRHLPER